MKRMHKDTLIGLYKTRVLGHRKTDRTRLTLAITTLTLSLLFMPYVITAQTATMAGKVTDELTGEPLQGAELTLEATGLSATTDRDGRYILRNIPPDTHNLSIRFPAYVSKEMAITVSAGERLAQTLELQQSFADGDKIFVEAAQRDRAQVVAAQQHSKQIKSVVTLEQINRWGDASIQEALIRIPGVQAGSQGDINLRGAGLNRYYVTVDGQRIGSTGLGDRSVNLDMLPVDLYRELEVINVLSPDMDADAIGGVINLTTYQPVGRERALNVTLGGDANAQYFDFTGPGNRASIRYSETLTDELALAVNLSHQLTHQSWERLEIDYDVADFGNGPVDVVERVAPGLHNDSRRSVGGGLHLTYQPSDWATYHLRSLINSNNRLVNINIDNYTANGDWINPESTGLLGNQGEYRHEAQQEDISIQNLIFQGGANYLFNSIQFRVNMEWSQSQIEKKSFVFPFTLDGMNFDIDMNDRSRTQMNVASPHFLMDDGSIDRRFINMASLDRIYDDHVDNIYLVRMDVDIPHKLGTLQWGSNVKMMNKTGEFDERNLTYAGRYNMSRFAAFEQRDISILNKYTMPWLIEQNGARNFLEAQLPKFSFDEDLNRKISDIWNYQSYENIYSGYGMANFERGNILLRGGMRIEHTVAKYEGSEISLDEMDSYVSSLPVNKRNSYTHLFPNTQILFSPGNLTNILLAYSRSIERPPFQMLAPFEIVNLQDTTLFRGNMELEPVSSNNLDFKVNRHTASLGVLSIGLFYKDLQNFVTLQQQIIQAEKGQFREFDSLFNEQEDELSIHESSFNNSDDTATLYGAEFSWRQHLSFLPGFLSNFGTFVNYTWTDSFYKTDRQDEVEIPWQSPQVVNAAVEYTQNRFYIQVSYNRTASFLSNLGQSGLAPSLYGSESTFLDQYQDGHTDLSASFRFRISDQFRFWADASNLWRRERIGYQGSRDNYPSQIDYNGGRNFRIGIRFDL
ncbi:MAG: carboxypeptidase regulatory-like domain-containing protein [Balneolales bacterium]